jgi:hypothetical protein
LVTRKTLASQKLLRVDTQVIVTWNKFETLWRMLEDFPLQLSRVMRANGQQRAVLPFSEQPTPCRHTSLARCTLIVRCNRLSVNFQRTKVFSV